jgi:hypothetical protein
MYCSPTLPFPTLLVGYFCGSRFGLPKEKRNIVNVHS